MIILMTRTNMLIFSELYLKISAKYKYYLPFKIMINLATKFLTS